jgi:hypothetical protein
MALLGYLDDVPSERRLVEEAALNLAYRWFLGYDLDEAIPDHSALSKARQRFGPTVYLAFFAEVVRRCERAGLVKGNLLDVDSTPVPADADADRVGSRALLSQLPDVGEHVARVFAENADLAEPEAEPSPPRPVALPPPVPVPVAPSDPPPAAGAAAAMPPIVRPSDPPGGPPAPAVHLAGPGDPPNRTIAPHHQRMVSRTDPDAEVVRRGGVVADRYDKAHVGVDGGRARIVTAVEVTAGAVADEHLRARVVAEHEGTTGRAVQEVVADAK